jgi:NAD(P)H-dependent flavin oxidoreductase YrpB (nitropropane dioxygenase family)
MISTGACSLLGIDHPVVLAGMGGGATDPRLTAAVSNGGGLGIMGVSDVAAGEIGTVASQIRRLTDRPFGLNLLLFDCGESIDAVLSAQPAVLSTAWPSAEQDLGEIFGRAHQAGAVVVHMVATLAEARRAAEAGADLIVAQGTEGGGHVGLVASAVLVPQVARAVAPLPVLAAGGYADGAGLAAALMLGAEGVLLGTRFLATREAPVSDAYKQVLLRSDGHDTLLSPVPDLLAGAIWPGAYGRVVRNRLIETWTGREGQLRARRGELFRAAAGARRAGDTDASVVWAGQSAGLITSIEAAGELIEQIVRDAERVIRERAELITARNPASP